MAVGIFYYGVAEPLYHQNGHWFANAGYHTQDEIDQMAMTYTLFHWGFFSVLLSFRKIVELEFSDSLCLGFLSVAGVSISERASPFSKIQKKSVASTLEP